MSEDSPNGSQRIVPMIVYEDAASAIDWLVRAFGFRENMRMADDDGRIGHAELEQGGGIIMLASPTPDYQSPRRHRESCEPSRNWSAVPWVIDGNGPGGRCERPLSSGQRRRRHHPLRAGRPAVWPRTGQRTWRVIAGCSCIRAIDPGKIAQAKKEE